MFEESNYLDGNYGFVKSRQVEVKVGTQLLLDFCQKIDFIVDFTQLLSRVNPTSTRLRLGGRPLPQALMTMHILLHMMSIKWQRACFFMRQSNISSMRAGLIPYHIFGSE